MTKFLTPANRVLASIGTILIFFQMLLICADIAGRFLLNRPIPGVFEVVELTIVAIIFLQLSNAISTGSLVRSDALLSTLKKSRPSVARAMEFFFNVVGMLVLAAIAYGVWFKFALALKRGHFTGNPGIFTAPIWPALLCIVIGCAWGALNFGALATESIWKPKQEGEPE